MKIQLAVLAVASGVVVGCAGSKTPPPRMPAPPAQAAAPPQPTDKSPSRAVVRIAEEIRHACGINEADAHFAFDSARVSSADYPTLDKVVKCFVSGPLARRQMRLVGHADPRGEEEYNLVLGSQRADGVRAVLVERGLSGNQAATTSRGEWDAKGVNEASWPEDRRVDIHLAD
jgi:peptidoglycan-associated lipoprotein